MRPVFILFILLIGASAEAQTICSAGINAAVGDTVSGTLYWDRFGSHSISADIKASGGEAIQIINVSESDGKWDFNYVSAGSETLSVIGRGNTSGWRCHIDAQITAHQSVQVVSPADKDRARQQAASLSKVSILLTAGGIPLACNFNFPLCLSLSIIDGALQVTATNLQRRADDPPDDSCDLFEPNFPNPSDLGMDWVYDDPFGDGVVANNANEILYRATLVEAYGWAAYVSANRTKDACPWQADRARWFWSQMGENVEAMSWPLQMLAYELDGNFNPQLDDGTYLSSAMQDTSGTVADAAYNLQNPEVVQ